MSIIQIIWTISISVIAGAALGTATFAAPEVIRLKRRVEKLEAEKMS